jgi:hypothetical protein
MSKKHIDEYKFCGKEVMANLLLEILPDCLQVEERCNTEWAQDCRITYA